VELEPVELELEPESVTGSGAGSLVDPVPDPVADPDADDPLVPCPVVAGVELVDENPINWS
jgi:hypothetical protein